MTTFSLNKFKSDNSTATHRSWGKYNGNYNIPLINQRKLYKFISKNPEICLTELPSEVFPLYFDIDNLSEHLDIDIVIQGIIQDNIKKMLNVGDSRTKMRYCLLVNKSKPNFYHLHFPNLKVSYNTAIIIANLINRVEPNLIDASVYKTGLRIFKTLKPHKDTKKPLEDTDYVFVDEKTNEDTIKNQMKLVTIQLSDTTETPIREDFIQEEEEKKEEKDNVDNLSKLCNELFAVDAKWTKEQINDNCYILTSNITECVVERGHNHSGPLGHSWVQINRGQGSKVQCRSHDKKPIEKSKLLSKIKEELGLVKSDKDENDYEKLMKRVIQEAVKYKYKRSNGYIMKPHDKIPIVYERHMEYSDFINSLFSNMKDEFHFRLYRKSSRTIKNLLDTMEKVDHPQFNFMQPNKYIFGFINGYLDITDLFNLKFTDYKDMDPLNMPSTGIYYDKKFDIKWLKDIKLLKTPKFDKVCTYHFGVDQDCKIYNIFLGMVGRLHYPLGKYDQFNCMMFIKGGSNTGKSTTGNIITSNHQNIGTISGKMEDTFGLQSLRSKNIIYVQEMPKNLSKKLDKSDLQRMIEGSNIDIPRKGLASINDFKWEIPLLFLGNYFPEYEDSSGAIPRRLCIFFMDKFVDSFSRDTSLEADCIKDEGFFILLKTLHYYKKLITSYPKMTFEDWNIPYFKKGYEELMGDCNYLYKFLTLAPYDFDYWPVYEKGAELALKGKGHFKEKFEKYLYFEKAKDKRWKKDETTLGRMGYEIITKNVCGMCCKEYQEDKTCCANFSIKNLREKDYILNMKIVRKEECEIDTTSDIDSDDED